MWQALHRVGHAPCSKAVATGEILPNTIELSHTKPGAAKPFHRLGSDGGGDRNGKNGEVRYLKLQQKSLRQALVPCLLFLDTELSTRSAIPGSFIRHSYFCPAVEWESFELTV